MENNRNTYTDTHKDFQTSKEWIDKTVAESFDELFIEISSEKYLHSSEEHNRAILLLEHSTSKIYDLINSYHAFCRLCEQHFYTRTISSDINSFFQNHINTPYHRQMRTVELPPDDAPMFTWEEKFHSGQCNMCRMSGLDSYIIDTGFDPLKLMRLHVCVWDKENRETNEKFLRKLNLLKKYCRLSIFRKKFIKTVNGNDVCLLCEVRLPWTGERARCHLGSDGHYRNLCTFLRKFFSFDPKDVLNGFNLEVVTRWLLSWEPIPIAEFTDYDEQKICMEQSNNGRNPYSEKKDNFSYSPKDVGRLQDKDFDFIQNDECLLCDLKVDQEHMKSDLHRFKALNLREESFDSKLKYEIFFNNMHKRQRILENYKTLELGQEKLAPPLPSTKITDEQAPNFNADYFKMLFDAKLELVNSKISLKSSWKIYCHVCDQEIPVSAGIAHLNSSKHKFENLRWDELTPHLAKTKFSESFVKVKHTFICLLCAVFITPNSLYAHLKGRMHMQKHEWYTGLDIDTPLSSAFKFCKDFSCTCTTCGKALNPKMTMSSLKLVLKNLMLHWPCPTLKEKKTDPENIPEGSDTTQEVVNCQDVLVTCPIFRERSKGKEMEIHAENCARNSMNFQKVEKAVESIVDVFANKIIKNVYDKSLVLTDRSGNSRLVSAKKLGAEGLVTAQKTLCECARSALTCSCQDQLTVNGDREGVDEKFEKLVLNELKAQETESNVEEEDSVGEKEEATNENGREQHMGENRKNKEKEFEVLLITGLPCSKRKYDKMFSKFRSYGKIRHLYFDGQTVVVAFAEPGIAEKVAKGQTPFPNNEKVIMTVSRRKGREKTSDKLPNLNKNLVILLEDPQKLMDFVLNLIVQATNASESLVELKREEFVCSTIISAVMKYFPGARCYPFGSRLSGLTLNNSDFDVFLDCGGMYEGFKNTSRTSERKLARKVASLLRKKQEVTSMVVVDRARVPIVSFLHIPTSMRCDLSFKSGLSVQNTLLIKFMMSLDWRVRPLILFLKYWAKLCGLHGPSFFSSYALGMLVIYYLEQLKNPVLPTIESLQKNCLGRRMTIEGWDCSINMLNVQKLDNRDPLPHLLAGLFEFYAVYDYDTYIISPLTGTLLPREAFTETGFTKLPMSYKRHVLNIPSPIESLVNNRIPVCIVDPFDLSHVLTKGLQPQGLQFFKHFCRLSAECLRKGMTTVLKVRP